MVPLSGGGARAASRRRSLRGNGARLPESADARHRAARSRGIGAVVMRSLGRGRHIELHTSGGASAHAPWTVHQLHKLNSCWRRKVPLPREVFNNSLGSIPLGRKAGEKTDPLGSVRGSLKHMAQHPVARQEAMKLTDAKPQAVD